LEEIKSRSKTLFLTTLDQYLLWNDDQRQYWEQSLVERILTFFAADACDFAVIGCSMRNVTPDEARTIVNRMVNGEDSVNGINYFDRPDIVVALYSHAGWEESGLYLMYEILGPRWNFTPNDQDHPSAQSYIDKALDTSVCEVAGECVNYSVGNQLNLFPFTFPVNRENMALYMPGTYSDPENPGAEYTNEELFELYWPESLEYRQAEETTNFKNYPQGIVNFDGLMIPISGATGKNSHFVPSLAFGLDLYRIYDIPVRLEIEGSLLYKGQKTGFPEYHYREDIPSPGEERLFYDFTSTTDINYKIHTLYFNAFVDWHNGTKFTPFIGGGLGASFVSLRVFRANHLSFRDQYINPEDPEDRGPQGVGSQTSSGYYKGPAETRFSWHLSAGVSYSLTESIDFELMYRYADLGFKKTVEHFPYPAFAGGGSNVYYLDGIPSTGQGAIKYGSTEIDLRKAEQITVGIRYRF
jgi:opacity protein-like surface antigen